LQVPVHHPGRLPFAQLLDVRAGVRLRAQQHERLRRAAAEGIRCRREGLYRGEAPARGRHRLLRRDHAGRHGGHGFHRRAARLDRYPKAELDESLWPAIKLAYIGLLHDHSQPECAETFYNSVACQVLHRRHYHNEFIFWRPAVATEHLEGEAPTYRCYYPLRTGLRATLREIVAGCGLANPWEDLRRDLLSLARALRAHFPRPVRVRP